jgi:glycosyltransferase involved in cell wall biosynthesis
LEQSFDFCSLVNDPELVRLSDAAALKELAAVNSSWRMQTFADVRYHKIGVKSVLVEAEEAQREHLSQLAVVVVVRDAPWSALQAVLSLQAQELPVEVVVVNSGKIGIAEIFARHGIDVTVIEREESLNPGAAKNLGINATRAPLVSFLAADHVVRPDWSRRRAFVHQAGAAALGSSLDNANPHNPFAWAGHFFTLPRDVPASLRGGVSYQRRLFDTYGFFREDLQVGDDSEFHNRLPPELKPIRNGKIRALRPNPSNFFALIEDQFQRGAYAARFRYELYAESRRRISAFYLALARAIRAWRTAKKNRAVILLALPLISLAMAAHYLGGQYGLLRIRFDP